MNLCRKGVVPIKLNFLILKLQTFQYTPLEIIVISFRKISIFLNYIKRKKIEKVRNLKKMEKLRKNAIFHFLFLAFFSLFFQHWLFYHKFWMGLIERKSKKGVYHFLKLFQFFTGFNYLFFLLNCILNITSKFKKKLNAKIFHEKFHQNLKKNVEKITSFTRKWPFYVFSCIAPLSVHKIRLIRLYSENTAFSSMHFSSFLKDCIGFKK